MRWFGFGKRQAVPAQGAVGGIESTPPAAALGALGGSELSAPTVVANVGETLVPAVGGTDESKTWGDLTAARTGSVVAATETAPVGSTGGVSAPASEVETGHDVTAAGTIENAAPVTMRDDEELPAVEIQPPVPPIPSVENMTAGISSETPVVQAPTASPDAVEDKAISGAVSNAGLEPLSSTSTEPPAVVKPITEKEPTVPEVAEPTTEEPAIEPVVATSEPVAPVAQTPGVETSTAAPAEGLEAPPAEPAGVISPEPTEGETAIQETTAEEPNTEGATPANITAFPGTSLDEKPASEDPNAQATEPDGTAPETHADQPAEQPAEPQAA